MSLLDLSLSRYPGSLLPTKPGNRLPARNTQSEMEILIACSASDALEGVCSHQLLSLLLALEHALERGRITDLLSHQTLPPVLLLPLQVRLSLRTQFLRTAQLCISTSSLYCASTGFTCTQCKERLLHSCMRQCRFCHLLHGMRCYGGQ